jgi:UDP-3-O-[3-hydroxymyristoyl] glucosamine N-acyltransferase
METMITVGSILDYFKNKSFRIIASDVELSKAVFGPRNIVDASENHISFLSSKYRATASQLLTDSKASLIVVDSLIYAELNDQVKKGIKALLVLSETPKESFVDCLNIFFKEEEEAKIHSSAIIHPTARIGENTSIGPYTVIDKNVIIGKNCSVGANTHIQKGSIIGDRVVIRSNVTIGNWGFGFVKGESGANVNFPHYGNVVIEDDVQVGSSTCVDRGALGDTIIKKGVKIDNLVHVAHNVIIGENSLVIACTMIGGSTIIGDNCWVAPSVILRNGITIGDNTTLGMGCTVTKDIPSDVTVMGSPAMPLDDYKKLLKAQKKLIELND